MIDMSRVEALSRIEIQPVPLEMPLNIAKPARVRAVLERQVFLNQRWIAFEYRRTSEISMGMFPSATKEVLDHWLLHEMDGVLFGAGFSPIPNGDSEAAGVKDDPIWFCDGDIRDLKFRVSKEVCDA
jgi:hypothetical protein